MQQLNKTSKGEIVYTDYTDDKCKKITYEKIYHRALMTISSILKMMHISLNVANGQMENNLKDDYIFKMIMEFTAAFVNSDSLGGSWTVHNVASKGGLGCDKKIKDEIRLLYMTAHPRYGVRLIDLFHMMFKGIGYYYSLGPRMRRSNCSTPSPNIAVNIVYDCLRQYDYGVDEIRIKNLKKIYLRFKRAYGLPSIFDEDRER